MRIITRYVWREMVPNYFVGLAFFTFMLLVNEIFKMVKYVIERNIPIGRVSRLFVFTFPMVLSLTIPMGVLMASILSFGRLSMDNEVTAMRGSGISMLAIIRPNLLFGVLLFFLSLAFYDTVLPWGTLQYVNVRRQIMIRDPMADFSPRQAIRLGNSSFWFESEDEDKMMYNVYVTDAAGVITYAERAVFLDKEIVNDRLLLNFELQDVTIQERDGKKKEQLVQTWAPRVQQTFIESYDRGEIVQKDARSMTIRELAAKISEDDAHLRKIIENAQANLVRTESTSSNADYELEQHRLAHPEVYRHLDPANLPAGILPLQQAKPVAVRRLLPLQVARPGRKAAAPPKPAESPPSGQSSGRLPGAGSSPGIPAASASQPPATRPPAAPTGRERPAHGSPAGARPGQTPRTAAPPATASPPAVESAASRRSALERTARDRRTAVVTAYRTVENLQKQGSQSPSDVYELHKKFALPAACLIFTLVGAPLGMFSRRSGKGMGFGYSIIVTIAYYLFLTLGRGWVLAGSMNPVTAAWLPNIFLGVLGLALILKKVRE